MLEEFACAASIEERQKGNAEGRSQAEIRMQNLENQIAL
jgi:hypothetical protein